MLPSRGAHVAQRAFRSSRVPTSRLGTNHRCLSSASSINAHKSIRWRISTFTTLDFQKRNFSLIPSFLSSPSPSTAQNAAPTSTLSENSSTAGSATAATTSTSSAESIASPPVPEGTPIVSSTPQDSLEFTSSGYATVSEHVGYLKELGLNFGWGPTSFMQFFYEHVHVYSGLGWGLSIMLTATLYRVFVLAWPSLIASDQAARNMAMTPALQKAQKKMQAGEIDSTQYQLEFMKIRRTAGIDFKKMFLPILIQAPLGFGTFRLLRSMAELPVPGLDQGGFLWLTDLTHGDPYYILPIALAASMHIAAKRGYEGGATQANAMTPVLTWVLPGVMGAFMVWMPATLQLSFFTTSLLGLVQGRVLQNAAVRDRLGLFPFYKNPQATDSTPKTIEVSKVQRRPRGSQVQSQGDVMEGYQAPAASPEQKSWLKMPKVPNVGEKWQNFQQEVAKQGKLMGMDTKQKTAHQRASDKYDKTEPQRQWRR